MKADAKALNFITNEGIIRIPFFQRSYVWEQSNWEELFDDLISDKNHFLGSLIFKQLLPVTGQAKEVLLIDGQQRLTTLSILLKAIYDNFNDETKINVKMTLFNYLYYKENVTDVNYESKIKHSKNDSEVFEKILLTNDMSQLDVANLNHSKIWSCYDYFNKKIIELNAADAEQKIIKRLFSKIIDFNYRLFVVIDLEVSDDEQEIFDTINSSGIRLSSADIIKNAIFQKAISLNSNTSQILTLYTTYWANVFQQNPEKEKEWLQQRNTGRIKRDNMEILFHSYAVIKGFFDPEQHTLANLSSLYKQYISSFDYAGLKSLLADIVHYANLFYEYIITETDLYSFENQVHRTLHIMEELELTTFYPLVLYILKEGVNQEVYLHSLEKYIMRRAIANKSPKNYNKEVKDFVKNLNSLPEKANNDTTNEEVKTGLLNIKNSKAALLLFWIELHRRSEDVERFGITELKYNYSLEHILPQKWEGHWSDVPVFDENGRAVQEKEKATAMRNSLINSIGNMTLLKSKLNTSISNSDFLTKLNGNGRRKGIKHYGDLSITKEIYALDDGTDRDDWTEYEISNRSGWLFNEIIHIW